MDALVLHFEARHHFAIFRLNFSVNTCYVTLHVEWNAVTVFCVNSNIYIAIIIAIALFAFLHGCLVLCLSNPMNDTYSLFSIYILSEHASLVFFKFLLCFFLSRVHLFVHLYGDFFLILKFFGIYSWKMDFIRYLTQMLIFLSEIWKKKLSGRRKNQLSIGFNKTPRTKLFSTRMDKDNVCSNSDSFKYAWENVAKKSSEKYIHSKKDVDIFRLSKWFYNRMCMKSATLRISGWKCTWTKAYCSSARDGILKSGYVKMIKLLKRTTRQQ